MTDQSILLQLQKMPSNLKQEVMDFMEYLIVKHHLTDAIPEPAPKKSFRKYRGSLKLKLSREEIDAQLKELRGEWEQTGS